MEQDGTPDLARSRLYDGSDGLLFDRVCVNLSDERLEATGYSRARLARDGRADLEEAAGRFARLRFEDDHTLLFPGAPSTPWDGGIPRERPFALGTLDPPVPFPNYDSCELVLGRGFEATLDFDRLAKRVVTDGEHRWLAGALLTNYRWTGTHGPLGVLAAHGPSFARGTPLQAARGLDFTPTILHILGLPVGADMPGRVLTELLAAESLAGLRPVVVEPSYEGRVRPGRERSNPGLDEATEERLRALGYVR